MEERGNWLSVRSTAIFSYWQYELGQEDYEHELTLTGRLYEGQHGSDSGNAAVGQADVKFILSEKTHRTYLEVYQTATALSAELFYLLPEKEYFGLAKTLAASGDGRIWMLVNYASDASLSGLIQNPSNCATNIGIIGTSINKSRTPG